MRKLLIISMFVFALCAINAAPAYAGDCGCKAKKCCEQKTCTKCDSGCKSKCKSDCGCKKQKCGCKSKCDSGCKKSCCKQKTCTKCNSGSKCGCKSTSKCGCNSGSKCGCKDKCNKCEPKCGGCKLLPRNHHPYECCFTGSAYMCDPGCGDCPLPCKRKCEVCETKCKKVEGKDCCGCTTVSYEYETTCTTRERPRVVPWWFNDEFTGNIYLDDDGRAMGEGEDSGESEVAETEDEAAEETAAAESGVKDAA